MRSRGRCARRFTRCRVTLASDRAKAATGTEWQTLSISRDASEAFRIRPTKYLGGPEAETGKHARG